MEPLTPSELAVLFQDTLDKCGTFLHDADDETIGWCIFEEFDVGVISFLHPNSLAILVANGYISMGKAQKCISLRKKTIAIQNTDDWSLARVRTASRWREIFELADAIKAMA